MQETLCVLVVAHDEPLRLQLLEMLSADPQVTARGSSGADALAVLQERSHSVVLLGLASGSPKEWEAELQVARSLIASAPGGVVVVSSTKRDRQALEVLRLGALGCLDLEGLQPVDLQRALRAASRGEATIQPRLAGRLLDEILTHASRPLGARTSATQGVDPLLDRRHGTPPTH